MMQKSIFLIAVFLVAGCNTAAPSASRTDRPSANTINIEPMPYAGVWAEDIAICPDGVPNSDMVPKRISDAGVQHYESDCEFQTIAPFEGGIFDIDMMCRGEGEFWVETKRYAVVGDELTISEQDGADAITYQRCPE